MPWQVAGAPEAVHSRLWDSEGIIALALAVAGLTAGMVILLRLQRLQLN
jgi:hypothetical protein